MLTIIQKPFQVFRVKDVSKEEAVWLMQVAELKKYCADLQFNLEGSIEESRALRILLENMQRKDDHKSSLLLPYAKDVPKLILFFTRIYWSGGSWRQVEQMLKIFSSQVGEQHGGKVLAEMADVAEVMDSIEKFEEQIENDLDNVLNSNQVARDSIQNE